jgi:hypothetical protein
MQITNKHVLDIKEKHIEARLVKGVRKLGGIAWKFVSPQYRSVADRVCLIPPGLIAFVECKAPGKVLTPLQEEFSIDVRARGGACWVVSTYEEVDFLLELYRCKQLSLGITSSAE